MMSRALRCSVSCLVVVAGCAAGASAQSFRWLNDALPQPIVTSELRAVSADGTTAVGYAAPTANTSRAVKWTLSQSSAALLPDAFGSVQEAVANAVSADGAIVVGDAKYSSNLFEASTWTNDGAPVSLGGAIPGGFFGTAGLGCTDDGLTVVGSREQPGFIIEACAWNSGTLVPLGTQDPAGGFSIANDATSDGFVFVGSTDATSGTTMAFRWSIFSGYAILPDIIGGVEFGEARAITADGRFSVGYGSSMLGTEAVRWAHGDWATQGWNAPDELLVLGDLPGGSTLAAALAVSADGNTVVGYGTPSSGEIAATIWTPATGLRSLKQVLMSDYGIDVGAAVLREASGISADARVVVGIGRRGPGLPVEGWVVEFAPSSTCPSCAADYDQNGGVDGGDIGAFFVDFEQGLECADVDQNGGVDGGDIGLFFLQFEAGGC